MEDEDDMDPRERQQLAEQWRIVGEALKERSPAAFLQLLAMFASSAINGVDVVRPFV